MYNIMQPFNFHRPIQQELIQLFYCELHMSMLNVKADTTFTVLTF